MKAMVTGRVYDGEIVIDECDCYARSLRETALTEQFTERVKYSPTSHKPFYSYVNLQYTQIDATDASNKPTADQVARTPYTVIHPRTFDMSMCKQPICEIWKGIYLWIDIKQRDVNGHIHVGVDGSGRVRKATTTAQLI